MATDRARLTAPGGALKHRGSPFIRLSAALGPEPETMKVANSLKSLRLRDRNNRLIRRKGRVFIINKRNPRMKVRQG